jgi:hypothetical protein
MSIKENDNAGWLRRLVRRLGCACKKWGWVCWTVGILATAGWHFYNWQWWVAYVPLVILVEIAHKK